MAKFEDLIAGINDPISGLASLYVGFAIWNENTSKVLYCLHKTSGSKKPLTGKTISEITEMNSVQICTVFDGLSRDELVYQKTPARTPWNKQVYKLTAAGKSLTSFCYDGLIPFIDKNKGIFIANNMSQRAYDEVSNRLQELDQKISKTRL